MSSTTWDIRWIMSILPHRYPMLLIDRVLEIEPRRRIVALKNFTINEEFFQGHFPEHPIVPGVLLIEAMAQAGGILMLHDDPQRDEKLLFFGAIERARFRRPVVPGDQVRFEVEVLRLKSMHVRVGGRAVVDGKVHVEAELLSTYVPRRQAGTEAT
ncbi:MAG: fabZ [Acidobacteria bacterium]|nr:fabZ [Acidobacteriota bacterium]